MSGIPRLKIQFVLTSITKGNGTIPEGIHYRVLLIGVEASVSAPCMRIHLRLPFHLYKWEPTMVPTKQASIPWSPRAIIGASIKAEKY